MYNGCLYRKVDGVTMGSPLGPTISNFCLAHLENELLSISKFKPEVYLRYLKYTISQPWNMLGC